MSRRAEEMLAQMEKALDAAYDEGFEEGSSDAQHDNLTTSIPMWAEDELRKRQAYLRLGGGWDVTSRDRESYVAGFEDALKTLGLVP